ncbi:3293_t:CDS:2 [Paraglomus brasilianum]|uniref:3293_t:CDS:1 n=1 Tax=Paraglomus brasilianum TaxID=144538 RepID=A0A9N8WFA3_9GLOM|nr:3293_t:CDS:2 [Paraglomus brasilianum]
MAAVEIEQPSSPTNVLTLETTLPKTDTDNQSFSSTSTDRKTSSSTSASSNKDPTKRIRYSVRTPQTMTLSPTETDDSQSKKAKRRSFSFFKNNAKGEKKKDLSEKLNRSSDKRRLAKSQTAEKRIKRRSFMDIFHSSSESEIESDVSKHTRSRSLSLGKPPSFNNDDLDQNLLSPLPDSKSKRRSLNISESYPDEDRTRNNRTKNRLSLNLDLFTSKSSTRGIPGETSTSIGIPSFLANSLSIISAPTSPATERPKGILKRSLSQGQKIYKSVENAVKSNGYKNELGGSEVNTPATSFAEADVEEDNDFAYEGLGKGETEGENKDRKNVIENKNERQKQKEFDSSKLDYPNLLSPPLSPSLPPPPPTTPTPLPLTSSLNTTPIVNFTDVFVESPVDREHVYRSDDSKMTNYEKSLRNKVSETPDTLFQPQRTEQLSQHSSYEALLIRQLNLTERMEETLRRWENKFGDETDKQEDRETVVSESKEDEQRKDDTQADQLALTTEKVKNLEAKLSEQKAELDVLREVVLDLRSNQQLLITGDLSSYDPSNLSLIHSRLTSSFPHLKSSQSTTSILVNSLVVRPVAATYNIASSVIQTLYIRPFVKIVKVVWHKESSGEAIQI